MSTPSQPGDPRRERQSNALRMASIAFGMGIAAAVSVLVVRDVWAYALLGLAGVLVGWSIPRRLDGLGGLLSGVVITFVTWGGIEVIAKLRSCDTDVCSGISSPAFTFWLVAAFTVGAILAAGGGYLVARAVRVAAVRVGLGDLGVDPNVGGTTLFPVLVVVVIAASVGIGAWVDWIWWPVTSGLMLTLAAILITVVGGVLVIGRRGIVRSVGYVGLAVGVGLLAGQNLGPSRDPLSHAEGTITLRLTSPVQATASGPSFCSTAMSATELSVSSDPDLQLDTADRPFVSIHLDHGDRWEVTRSDAPRKDGVYLLITVTRRAVTDDGKPATIGMAATDTSTLTTLYATEGGRITFADLDPQVGVDYTGERLDLVGTVEWTCDRDPFMDGPVDDAR